MCSHKGEADVDAVCAAIIHRFCICTETLGLLCCYQAGTGVVPTGHHLNCTIALLHAHYKLSCINAYELQLLQVDEQRVGVVTFSGNTPQDVIEAQSSRLREALERDGYKIKGDWVLARYNPPFTLPFMKTNEVLYQVE